MTFDERERKLDEAVQRFSEMSDYMVNVVRIIKQREDQILDRLDPDEMIEYSIKMTDLLTRLKEINTSPDSKFINNYF